MSERVKPSGEHAAKQEETRQEVIGRGAVASRSGELSVPELLKAWEIANARLTPASRRSIAADLVAKAATLEGAAEVLRKAAEELQHNLVVDLEATRKRIHKAVSQTSGDMMRMAGDWRIVIGL